MEGLPELHALSYADHKVQVIFSKFCDTGVGRESQSENLKKLRCWI